MKIKIKRVDKSLPLPEYKTEGAAAFDLYARKETTIPAKGWALVPSNLIISTPAEHVLILSARSSLAKHYPGLFLANGVGLIDSDFSGPNDEIHISLYNMTDQDIIVSKGNRIAQGRFKKFIRAEWEEVEEITEKDRGSFGSTGLN